MELWVRALSGSNTRPSQPRSVGFTINRLPLVLLLLSNLLPSHVRPFKHAPPPVNLDSGASVRTAPRAIAGPITGKVSVTAEAVDSCIDAPLAQVAIPVCPVNDPVALCEKLDEEITSRRVMGPFSKPPFRKFHISPWVLCLKKTILSG